MKKSRTREDIQEEALNFLKMASGIGTLAMDVGVGKSKVAIDFVIETEDIKTILITTPRENLKKNLYNEIQKWSPSPSIYAEGGIPTNTIPFVMGGRVVLVTFENIQSCYKWNDYKFDAVILDEIHLIMTPEYSRLIEYNSFKYKIGLTGTPDVKDKPEKLELYNKYCPVIHTYLTAENDGIVNKTKIVVVEHILTNEHKV